MDMAFSGELAYETSVENEGNFCFTMMHEPNHFRKLRNRTSAELQNKMTVPAAILFREMHVFSYTKTRYIFNISIG